MDIYVDFSVIAADRAFANVHGTVSFSLVPRIGEIVSFSSPPKAINDHACTHTSFHLKVENVIHTPGKPENGISLCLETLVLESTEDAIQTFKCLENGFNLFADIYEEA